MQLRNLALIPVIGLLAVTLATLFSNSTQLIVFNSPNLVLFFNVIFWTVASAITVYASIRGFLRDGSRTVLLLTVSILIFGSASISSAFVQGFSDNFSLAIGDIGLFVASIIQLSASLFALFQKDESSSKNRKAQVAIAYVGALVFVALLSLAALKGGLPTFYSTGPTVLRQWVVGTSVVFFGTAFIVYGTQYVRSRSSALVLYSLGIALLALGFFSGFEIKKVGDLINWIARISTYASAVYIIAAFFAIRQLGAKTMASWAETFRIDQRQADALFSNMLDAFIYAKVITDVNGKPVDWIYLDVNNSFENISGVKKEQVIGKTVTSVFPKEIEDPADWIGMFGKVALTGEPIHLEGYREVFGKWVSVTAYSPKQGYFISIFDDITVRKKAEEAMQESEEKSRNLAEESPNMIFINQGGRIAYANKKSEDVLGYTREELYSPAFSFLSLNPPEYIEEVKLAEAKHLKGEDVPPYEFALITREGKRVDAIIATKLIDYQGKKAVMGIVTDISERKKVENKLVEYRRNLEKLVDERTKKLELSSLYARNLIEASLDPLVTISKEGKITDVNKATEEATGRPREELIGSDFSDYFTEPEEARAGYQRVFTEGFVKDYPLSIRHKSGKITDVLYNASIYKNPQGEMEGVFAAARDITERKMAEEQAQEAAKKLKDAERLAAIGATAGMVGHDIRNPLQGMTSDVYLAKTELASTPDSEEKENALESLDEIQKNIDYVNKIVQDLQDYARPLKPAPKETNLKKLIDDLLFKNGLPKNVKVHIQIQKEAEEIVADSDILKRVLSNLVTNAVQAMPHGGKLSIRAYKEATDSIITVADTGVGIPKDVKEKLFTPLFTTKSKEQGFGLAVVKRMTESLGGTVTFESEEGKGTTFIVCLPQKE